MNMFTVLQFIQPISSQCSLLIPPRTSEDQRFCDYLMGDREGLLGRN